MWVGSGRSTLCASANEKLGTLADNNPLTGYEPNVLDNFHISETTEIFVTFFSCLRACVIICHTTLAQGVGARRLIHVSCACDSDLSSTLSSHSSFVSPIFHFILLNFDFFLFLFHVDVARSPVHFAQ